MLEPLGLDEIDSTILRILSKNSRESFAEIARQVKLSRISVRERVLALKEKGVIEQFSLIVNAQALGYNLAVFLDIEVRPKELRQVAEQLLKQERITIVYQMTGTTKLHVHAYGRDAEELAEFMQKNIYSIPGVVNVNSHILLQKFKTDLTIC